MAKINSMLFVGKKDDLHCQRAVEFIGEHVEDMTVVLGKRGDAFPEGADWWKGEYIISYLSPWIIPAHVLKRAEKAAFNFHPGPPEYPGIGCTNFAIYNGETEYGITCHVMVPKVDTGEIVAVKRFPLYEEDTVLSLTRRCYGHMLALFYDIMDKIIIGEELPHTNETWTRKPYTRRDLDKLCRISTDESEEEVHRRVKAVAFPGAPGAFVEIGRTRFEVFDAEP